ncbi:MAG: helix-turn-helix domain-containing protein [Smithella sp.]
MTENTRKNRVKKYREEIPLSISELARKAGLTPQTIAKMEKGLPTRKNSQLKVAKALNKKYNEVFEDITDT